jgi:hypothetical protein
MIWLAGELEANQAIEQSMIEISPYYEANDVIKNNATIFASLRSYDVNLSSACQCSYTL